MTDSVPLKLPTTFGAVNRTTTLHEPLTARLPHVVETTEYPAPVLAKLARLRVAAALPLFLTDTVWSLVVLRVTVPNFTGVRAERQHRAGAARAA